MALSHCAECGLFLTERQSCLHIGNDAPRQFTKSNSPSGSHQGQTPGKLTLSQDAGQLTRSAGAVPHASGAARFLDNLLHPAEVSQ